MYVQLYIVSQCLHVHVNIYVKHNFFSQCVYSLVVLASTQDPQYKHEQVIRGGGDKGWH